MRRCACVNMSVPPASFPLKQPKPGCVVTFLVIFLLASVAAWIWSFYPPMPSESDLTEVMGAVEKWEEKEVRLRKNLLEHELHIRLAGQTPDFFVERYGYDGHFKRDVPALPGTNVTLLVEKSDLEKAGAGDEVRTRAVRSGMTEYFSLDGYRAGVRERRGWGWAMAAAVTAFTVFCCWRVWKRRQIIFAKPAA